METGAWMLGRVDRELLAQRQLDERLLVPPSKQSRQDPKEQHEVSNQNRHTWNVLDGPRSDESDSRCRQPVPSAGESGQGVDRVVCHRSVYDWTDTFLLQEVRPHLQGFQDLHRKIQEFHHRVLMPANWCLRRSHFSAPLRLRY